MTETSRTDSGTQGALERSFHVTCLEQGIRAFRFLYGSARAQAAGVSLLYWVFFSFQFHDTAMESGELASSSVYFGAGPMPGYSLLHQLGQLAIFWPFGSIGGRLILLNGMIMGIALYHYARLCRDVLEEPLLSLIPPIGLFAGVLFFRNTFFYTPVPLTFLCVVTMLRLMEWPLVDARRLWAAAFILGLGFVGVHPVFRLLLVPFMVYLLWVFPRNRTAVSGAVIFGLAGAAIAIFIPLAAHRYASPLADPSVLSGTSSVLSMGPVLDLARHRVASPHSFVWWPDLMSQFSHLGDTIPLILLPMALLGLWPQRNHARFTVLAGLGLAEWAYSVWMLPGAMGQAQTGWLLSAALWLGCARGVGLIARQIAPAAARTGFVTFFLLAGFLATWLSDGGERFFLEAQSPRRALESEIHLEQGVSRVVPHEEWGSQVAAAAFFGKGFGELQTTVFDGGPVSPDGAGLAGQLWSPLLVDHLPAGWSMVPSSPEFGKPVRLPVASSDKRFGAESIARSLMAPVLRQPSFVRERTARLLCAWGQVFLRNREPEDAAMFLTLARAVSPQLTDVHLLHAGLEAQWGRHENARMILNRISRRDGGNPRVFALLAQVTHALVFSGRIRAQDKRQFLISARQAIRRALILSPGTLEYQELLDQILRDLEP